MKSCPIKNSTFKFSEKTLGRYATYAGYNQFGMVLPAYTMQSLTDRTEGFVSGITQYCKDNKFDHSFTYCSAFLKFKNINTILYKSSDENNQYFSDNPEGIAYGCKLDSVYYCDLHSGDIKADLEYAKKIAIENGYDAINLIDYDINGSSVIYPLTKLNPVNINKSELDKFVVESYDKHMKEKIEGPSLIEMISGQKFVEETDLNGEIKDKFIDMFDSEEEQKQQIAINFADKLSKKLNVKYKIVSQEEAYEITGKNNPAFFYKGTVYFVKGKLSIDSVFHEFCHPFVRTLKRKNHALFEKIIKDFLNTEKGVELLNNLNNEYDYDDDSLMAEELFVYALQQSALNDNNEIDVSEFIYGLKKTMRSELGGNIDLDSLSINTSMKELIELLKSSDSINIDTTIFTKEDIATFYDTKMKTLLEKGISQMSGKSSEIKNTIENSYKLAEFLYSTSRSSNFEDVLSKMDKENAAAVRNVLKQYTSSIDINDEAKMASALAHSLCIMEDIAESMLQNSKNFNNNAIVKHYGSDIILRKSNYYKQLCDNIQGFVDTVDSLAKESGLDHNNELRLFFDKMRNVVSETRDEINKVFFDACGDTLSETLFPMMENINKEHQDKIQYLIDNNAPQWRIDQEHKAFYGMTAEQKSRYDQLREEKKNRNLTAQEETERIHLSTLARTGIYFDQDTIREILRGEAGDLDTVSTYFDSYLQIVDPVVGGFATYLKNGITDSLVRAQEKVINYINDIKDDLARIGYDPNKLNEFRELLCFKDIIAVYNPETGTYDKKEIWSYKHEFKNWRYEVKKRESEVDEARELYQANNTEEARINYLEKKFAFDKWRRTFFKQPYKSEFYDKYKVFEKFENDKIGHKAFYRIQELFDKMNLVSDGDFTYVGRLSANTEMKKLWKDYGQLSSVYNIDGSEKTGEELEIALRIKEFKEISKDYYENTVDGYKLVDYLSGYLEEKEISYRESGMSEDQINDRLKDDFETWKRIYMHPKIKDDFFEYRQSLVDKMSAIFSKIPEYAQNERIKSEQTKLWKRIFDLCNGVRDDDNILDGTQLHENARAEVKSLQEKINEMRSRAILPCGLTREEVSELNDLYYNKIINHTATPEEKAKFDYLHGRFGSGLTEAEIAEIKRLQDEIYSLMTSDPTSYFIDTINDFISNMPISVKDTILNMYGTIDLSKDTIAKILNEEPNVISLLAAHDRNFAEFIEKNTFENVRYDRESKSTITYYTPIYCWLEKKPDESWMESFSLALDEDVADSKIQSFISRGIVPSNGNIIEFSGLYPSNDFITRIVKPEYRTSKEIGISKDNQDGWLPKSMEEMDLVDEQMSDEDRYQFINLDYIKLKNENPAAFELLEKMKMHHLEFQRGLGLSERMYYDVPRMAVSKMEKMQRTGNDIAEGNFGTVFKRWHRRFIEFFTGNKQSYGDTINYDSNVNLLRADLFTSSGSKIPILGLQDILLEDQSANLITNEIRYMGSIEKHNSLKKMNPLAVALQEVLKNNKVKSDNTFDKNSFLRNIIKRVSKYQDDRESKREMSINVLIDREFKGKFNLDGFSDLPVFQNAFNFLAGKAAFSFFAWNPVSSLKNALGMKSNFAQEASAMRYVNPKDMIVGEKWAAEAIIERQMYQRKRDIKPLKSQMVELFDFNQDKFIEGLGQNMSRTKTSDVIDGKFFYSFRRATEDQAIYQMGSAMLNNIKIERRLSNNDKEVISYLDAWELDDNGVVKLKDGIDARYNKEVTKIDVNDFNSIQEIAEKYNVPVDFVEQMIKHSNTAGFESIKNLRNNVEEIHSQNIEMLNEKFSSNPEYLRSRLEAEEARYQKDLEERGMIILNNIKFKEIKNRIHGTENHMGGAYASFDQPLITRNLFFRFAFMLKKYFPAMFDKRFGSTGIMRAIKEKDLGYMHGRRNYAISGINDGTYPTVIKYLLSNMTHIIKGEGGFRGTPEELQALRRWITEGLILLITSLLIKFALGFDDDDDDKYKKLRKKSGALPMPFVDDTQSKNFSFIGWSELNALNLLLQLQNENSQFFIPSFSALKNYSMVFDWQSVVMGPTINNVMQISNDFENELFGNTKGSHYSRNVGPYLWQTKDSFKAWNHFFKMFGISGTLMDPMLGIQNTFAASQRATNR